MNDVHDSFVPGWLCNWKKENPDLLVDRTGMLADRALYVTAADFTHPKVRGRKFEIIEKVGNRYDIDAYELDYIRHSVLFSRSMRGQPITSEEVEIITFFMRRVRQFTDHLGARRGRPVLIASRVPGTIEKCLNIGLDVKTWLEDDLVDILIGGGEYSPFTIRISDFTQLADPYEVPVYPCINQGAAFGLAGSWTNFTPVTRALASRWYREGARGVYLWNL